MNRPEYLRSLNEAQYQAVLYNDGPALVLAGAGSGKTRVLVYKLLHLIKSGYPAYKLMALTFTNKAAREMRSRMTDLVGSQARSIQMGTFHSIFSRILREHAHLLGYTRDFSIYNNNDSKSLVKQIIKEMALDDKVYQVNRIYAKISRAKNDLRSPEAYRNHHETMAADNKAKIPRTAEIYARYTQRLKEANAMDFDDLLYQTSVLFRDHPEVLSEWQERIDYLLIDEYQDTNFAQYMIARQLMQNKGKIFVVGDDAQSIYSFRGANIQNILGFQNVFRDTKVFKLEQNYRSTQTIVNASKALIAHNEHQLHKDVFSEQELGEPIHIYQADSGENEAGWLALHLLGHRVRYTTDWDDYAILYRTNQQSRLLEQKLRQQNVPFRIWGGHSFFNYKEIMDTIAYLRLMINPSDNEAMLRIINYPKRGIGDTTIKKLQAQAISSGISFTTIVADPIAYGADLSKSTLTKIQRFVDLLQEMRELLCSGEDLPLLVQELITRSGIPQELRLDTSEEGKDRLKNLDELLASIDEYTRHAIEEEREVSLSSYLNEIALLTDQDTEDDEDSPKVTLMTIHAAKGLEFSHVFITGLEEQLFPSMLCTEPHELEEERRLFYVAITRAEQTCTISYALERFRNGRTERSRPSRFLRELPERLCSIDSVGIFGIKTGSPYYPLGQEVSGQGKLPESFPTAAPIRAGSRLQPMGERLKQARGQAVTIDRELVHSRVGSWRQGQRVSHPRFGTGVIDSLEGRGDELKAIVRFDDGETKKLLMRFAKLLPLD